MLTRSEVGPGEVVGHYRVLARLATGGMTDVWLAEVKLPEFTRRVVLKSLRPQFAEDPLLLKTFMAEAAIAAKLVHPNVVEVLDYGEAEGKHFLATEFVFGRTLGQIARRARRRSRGLDLWFPLRAALEVCSALGYIHAFDDGAKGLVHRDVSPENIMVAFTGVVKLLDFGIVAANVAPARGRLVGKFRYMAPERMAASECGPASDIFSLGVVLYEYLAGVLPFDSGEDVPAMSASAFAPLPPSAHNPMVDEALSRIVMRAIASNPGDRYRSAEELAQDLRRYLARAEPDGLYNPLDAYVSDLFLGETSTVAEPLTKLFAERRFPSPPPTIAPLPADNGAPLCEVSAPIAGAIGVFGPIEGFTPPMIPPVAVFDGHSVKNGASKLRPPMASSPSRPGSTPSPVPALEPRGAIASAMPSRASPPFSSSPTPTPKATGRAFTPPLSLSPRIRETRPSVPDSRSASSEFDASSAPTPPEMGLRDHMPAPEPLPSPVPSSMASPSGVQALMPSQERFTSLDPNDEVPVEITDDELICEDGAPLSPSAAAAAPPAASRGYSNGVAELFNTPRVAPRPLDIFPTRLSLSQEDLTNAGSRDIFATRADSRTHLAFSTARRDSKDAAPRYGSVVLNRKEHIEPYRGSPLAPQALKAAEAFDRGLAFFGKKNHDQALSAWREAVALDPANRTYQSNLRRLERLIGRSPS